MGAERIYRCECCDRIVKIEDVGFINKQQIIYPYNAVTITLGYSIGGWGSRRDWANKSCDYICKECFDEIEPHAKAIYDVLSKKRGTNKTQVSFWEVEKRPTEHHMPDMQENELPSEGYFRKILRLLS